MKQHKDHQEEEEEEEEEDEEELSMKKEGASTKKDGKNHEKANAMRSKHSVTEQRRRSKINERFQILRDLIPHSDQKRDTASFLLEVIEYIQYLQEKLQKYEGSYQGLTPEPTKLIPWRNSHWRVQSFVSHSQAINNGSGPGPGSAFSGKFDENNINMASSMLVKAQNPVESDLCRDATCKAMDHQSEFNKAVVMPMSVQSNMPASVQSEGGLAHALQGPLSDAQSSDCPITCETLSKKEDLIIEGGTISISSTYSQGLLNTLTQALQSCGVDLSQARISVQIDLGKRANRGLTSGTSIDKGHENPPPSNDVMGHHHRDASSAEDSDQSQKRLKT